MNWKTRRKKFRKWVENLDKLRVNTKELLNKACKMLKRP